MTSLDCIPSYSARPAAVVTTGIPRIERRSSALNASSFVIVGALSSPEVAVASAVGLAVVEASRSWRFKNWWRRRIAKNPEAWSERARMQLMQGAALGAIRDYQRAIAILDERLIFPDSWFKKVDHVSTMSAKADAYIALAEIYLKFEMYKEASDAYESASRHMKREEPSDDERRLFEEAFACAQRYKKLAREHDRITRRQAIFERLKQAAERVDESDFTAVMDGYPPAFLSLENAYEAYRSYKTTSAYLLERAQIYIDGIDIGEDPSYYACCFWDTVARCQGHPSMELYLMLTKGFEVSRYLPLGLRKHVVSQEELSRRYPRDSMEERQERLEHLAWMEKLLGHKGVPKEKRRALASAIIRDEQVDVEWRWNLEPADYVEQLHADGSTTYQLNPSPNKAAQFVDRVRRRRVDLFPQLELSPAMKRGVILERLRSFLQRYRTAESLFRDGNAAAAHPASSAQLVAQILRIKGFEAFTVDEPPVAAVPLGNAYYLIDINAQRLGPKSDRLIIVAEDKAHGYGYNLGKPLADVHREKSTFPHVSRFYYPDLEHTQRIIVEYLKAFGL